MNTQIHPTWYPEAKVSCACGNTFSVGATVSEIKVEVCYNCHPFYTGQMKYVDTAGRVEAFKSRQLGAQKDFLSKAEKRRLKKANRLLEEMERPDTLEALRKKQ